MKILIVRTFPDILKLNSYNVQEIGLAKALNSRGHQCDVVLYGGSQKDHLEKYSFDNGKEKSSFCIYWLKGYSLFKNGFMPSLIKYLPLYDVIQVHEYDQVLSWLIYAHYSKPVVIYHGPYYHKYTKGYNLKCRVFDLLFLHGKRYRTIPALTKSVLAKDFLLEKGFKYVKAVGVGLDEEKIKKTVPQAEIVPQKQKHVFRMLYIGKIEERRNVYFLIEVFRKIRKNNDNVELVIVGNGEEAYTAAFLNSIEKERKEEKIIYIPSVPQNSLASVYQEADCFLFTSNYEIFGMVLLEAMYFGLPVISSRNGGSVTLIEDGENGFVLDGFNLDEWCEKIESLMTDETRRKKMSHEAIRKVSDHYLWEKLVDQFIEAYEQAIGEE